VKKINFTNMLCRINLLVMCSVVKLTFLCYILRWRFIIESTVRGLLPSLPGNVWEVTRSKVPIHTCQRQETVAPAIHPYMPVLKLSLLVDRKQKVGELVLSLSSCLAVSKKML
jgi:hypothetical protein